MYTVVNPSTEIELKNRKVQYDVINYNSSYSESLHFPMFIAKMRVFEMSLNNA